MRRSIVMLALGMSGMVHAQAEDAFSYEGYADVLKAYVDDDGMVNYRGLKAKRAGLDEFVRALGALSKETYASWDEAAQIAFWCNAYNAITLTRIIDHYPIKKGGIISGFRFPVNSIRQIDGVWEDIETRVLGTKMTLDHIEHGILRVKFNEARIHMAIVCAAISCPTLRTEPYVGDRLEEQLEDQSRDFCARPDKFKIDRTKNRVYVSAILDWFGGDFVKSYTPASGFSHLRGEKKAVAYFLSRHVNARDAEYLRGSKYSTKYLDYDWSLNEQ